MAEQAAATKAKEAAAAQARLDLLRELNNGALDPEVHGDLIRQLHSKLALARPEQGALPEDDGTSTSSWLAISQESSSQAKLRRRNGDVHA